MVLAPLYPESVKVHFFAKADVSIACPDKAQSHVANPVTNHVLLFIRISLVFSRHYFHNQHN